MEIKTKKFRLFLATLLTLGIVPTIVSLCMVDFQALIFTLIPWVFSGPIFFSFFLPRDVLNHKFLLVISFLSRILMILLSLLIPMILYAFLPGMKGHVSYFWFFGSFAIVMLSNLFAAIYGSTNTIIRKDKQNGQNS